MVGDTDRNGTENGCGRLMATIGKGNGVLLRQGFGRKVMLLDERSIDEVASRAAVDEEDSTMAGDGAFQLDEALGRGGELVDLC
jgi:hypothetical protein